MIQKLVKILLVWFLGSIPLGLIVGRLLSARNRADQVLGNQKSRGRN